MKAEQRVQGRYTLIEPLGSGGMAEVWLAHDERLERNVAVKFMAANLTHDPEFLVRFFAEAQAVARISHPNVVAVLDFGELEGRPYLVMECAPGGSLSAATGTPLVPERAVEIVTDAARGAGAAHRAGLVHRDVKPANILLDDGGRAKLADFGIASSAMAEKLTATGTAIGSPHYISPEQVSGRPVTAASDVYSLGAVLYELLTGRPPFDGDNVTALAIAHVEQAPVPPGDRIEGVPEELDALVLACLAKDPAARPPDGAALAEALEAGAAPAPARIAAEDDGEDYYYEEDGEPRTRRRWLVAALIAGSVALGSAGAVYVSGRPDEVARAGTEFPPRRQEATPTPRPKRSTATPASAPAAVPSAAPNATPSLTPTPEPEDPTPTPRPERAEDEEPLWTPDPTPEPTAEPSEEPAPSEEPSAPPSEEPTPAP